MLSVDAVLSGPREVSGEALSSVLGVSQNTLTRVRRLADRINQEAAVTRTEHKMRLVALSDYKVIMFVMFSSRRLKHRNSESNLVRGTLR